jgi:hypothetical protein
MTATVNAPKYAHLQDIERIHFHAERICKAMGAGWSLDSKYFESHWMRRLNGPAGHGLSIALEDRCQSRKPCRLSITGFFPYEKPYDLKHSATGIKVSEEKEAETIVKDIERRFMPEYLQVFDACAEAREQHDQYETQKAELFRAAVEAAGEVGSTNKNTEGMLHISSDNCDLYGDVRVTSDHSYEINLRSVPVKAAMAILTVLKELKKG